MEGGSFLDKFREVLDIDDTLPEDDTPFNPEAFRHLAAISKARKRLIAGGISEIFFGINLPDILAQVGMRIGEELSFSLRSIEGDIEFLNEMMDWWEHAGLGELSYGIDPGFHIKAILLRTRARTAQSRSRSWTVELSKGSQIKI